MINTKELSRECFYYEMFMERAYGKYEPTIPGGHASLMKNLIIAEHGKTISPDIVALFEKKLIEIKYHMEDAFDNYMAIPNVSPYIMNRLTAYKEQVIHASSSGDLLRIVLATIDLTVSVPIEMNFN